MCNKVNLFLEITMEGAELGYYATALTFGPDTA